MGSSLNAGVIIVLLRRPYRHQSDERRDDPFWEFGSFGCTGCHRTNLMNPRRSHELVGKHLAFVQGGDRGSRLVHVTPPIVDICRLSDEICEAVWSPTDMPLAAVDWWSRLGNFLSPTSRPCRSKNRSRLIFASRDGPASPSGAAFRCAIFASGFRSRRKAVAGEVGTQILSVYQQFRRGGAEVAKDYVQAMPYEPPQIEQDRRARYELKRRGACDGRLNYPT